VFDVRVGSINPPGPAIVGQTICGETGPRLLHPATGAVRDGLVIGVLEAQSSIDASLSM
jgi:hypothetical protein